MTTLGATFAALADPTRRAILARLVKGETTVGELARPFAISPPAISRHLKVLEGASLIINERRGKHRFCRLDPSGFTGAGEWIDFYRKLWTDKLDRLEQHFSAKRKPR
jgi:DNA-binding transcriptional ArsR family regulator